MGSHLGKGDTKNPRDGEVRSYGELIMARYLKGTVHYLTEEQAKSYKDAVIRQEPDGTFSVFTLSENPVQPGQPEWQE